MQNLFDVFVIQDGGHDENPVKVGKAFLEEGLKLKIVLDLYPVSGYLKVELESQNGMLS